MSRTIKVGVAIVSILVSSTAWGGVLYARDDTLRPAGQNSLSGIFTDNKIAACEKTGITKDLPLTYYKQSKGGTCPDGGTVSKFTSTSK